jgi:hypothetical protein
VPNRTILVPLVAVILLIYALFSGGPIPSWGSINRTAAIVGFLLLAWDYYLWRIPWFYPEIVPLPNLRGTWKANATIFHLPQPAAIGKVSKVTADYEEAEGYVIIRQTGSGFKFTALWDDDRYTSIMKHLAPATGSDGRGVFVGQYENKAGLMIGLAGIVIYTTAHPKQATIYYTTIENVPQRGQVVLKDRVRQFCDTRDEARALPSESKRIFKQKLQFLFRPW